MTPAEAIAACLAAAAEAYQSAIKREDGFDDSFHDFDPTWPVDRLAAWFKKQDRAKFNYAVETFDDFIKGRLEPNPKAAARIAYLNAMPMLVSRGACKAFIACVAVGLQRKYLEPTEAKTLMYTAQLALAVHRPRARRLSTTPTTTSRHGFAAASAKS